MAAWCLGTVWTPVFFLGLDLVVVMLGLCFGLVIFLKNLFLPQPSFALQFSSASHWEGGDIEQVIMWCLAAYQD